MAILCKPAVAVPENIVTVDETLDMARRLHADNPKLNLALRLIRNTGVLKRHTILPLEETLRHPGFEERNLTYERHAKTRVPPAKRLMSQAPESASSALPPAMESEVAILPAVVTLTAKAATKIAGHAR